MAVDPVCKMEIKAEDAFANVEHEGRTYSFCSASCRDEFEKDAAKYTGEDE